MANRTALFIDGANLYATSKSIGMDVDFKQLLSFFSKNGELVRAYYYTALIEEQDDYQSIRPLIDWLSYNGYSLVTKPAKQWTDTMGRVKVKGNMDIEIAVDALDLSDRIDQAVIFSGDGDFRYLVLALQRRGVRVTVVSNITVQPAVCSDDLRRAADHFIDLKDLPVARTSGSKSRYG